jgi:hypothetical protein
LIVGNTYDVVNFAKKILMKIIEHTATKLTLRDSAGCIWLLGFFFIAVAGSFVVGLMGAFTNLNELSELEKLLGWFISLSGVAAGVWIIYTNPGVLVNFDKNNNTAIVNRRGLLKNETENYSLNEIADVVLDETTDSDGDPFYRIALKLNRDKQVLLFSTGLHHKETQQKNVDLIKQFLKT